MYFRVMTLGIIDLLIASVPVVGSIIGVYLKMNNLVVRQDLKIQSLEAEVKEMKRHNEKQEEKIFAKLDGIEEKITSFLVHFSRCSNFKVNQ